eukprot:SAG11_NODE_1117_length_5798_cov_10.203194_2_plen_48_part_00
MNQVATLSELASRVGEEMIVKRVSSVYGQYTHNLTSGERGDVVAGKT